MYQAARTVLDPLRDQDRKNVAVVTAKKWYVQWAVPLCQTLRNIGWSSGKLLREIAQDPDPETKLLRLLG